ncbi:MAG: beta-ketoacyl-[acyl-carrier-protein] synthase family protein [Chitinivibrionales bacterium]|nr:beta-ketoacyl-[acyl-carrier-protein] synthase family protein [Chitinivibrionales bacterium]
MALKKRVVITGLGVVSSCGYSAQACFDTMLAGNALVKDIPDHWKNYYMPNSTIYAPLPGLDFQKLGFSRIEMMQFDPAEMIALYCAGQALQSAGFVPLVVDPKKNIFSVEGIAQDRCGVFVGTGIGGITSMISAQSFHVCSPLISSLEAAQKNAASAIARLSTRFNPFIVPMMMPNGPGAAIGIRYSLKGPNRASCCACASGTVAIGEAFRAIRDDQCDCALSGGVEYLFDEYGGIFRGFDCVKTLAMRGSNPDTANRPFDLHRSGFLFAQGGAGVLFLESYEQAIKRSAPIIAEIIGYSETFDAYSMMSMEPSGESIQTMIKGALDDAGIMARAIDYINTHGTGTSANDETESMVIETMFGTKPLLNSTKSYTGHTIGAAGAIETAMTALSLYHQTTHGCRNLESPLRALNFAKRKTDCPATYALTHSFAFGGHNAGLILKKAAAS